MNVKIYSVLKKISYSMLANVISMSISVFMVLLLPKLLGGVEYGVWQLYLFYSSYLAFFHFGWLDGIYLRYGGCYFEKLNKIVFTSQCVFFIVVEVLISIIGIIFLAVFSYESRYYFLYSVLCIVLPLIMLGAYSSFVLQITNRIKEYAKLIVIERICFFVTILFLILLGYSSYEGLIVVDFISKLIGALYGIYVIRNLFVKQLDSFKNIFCETYLNISAGYKLLCANITGMLVIGIVRYGIAHSWNVETFGKISLILSIANIFMTFMNSVGVVLFPALKRIDVKNQIKIFEDARSLIGFITISLLLTYYPLEVALSWWLPKYKEAFLYLSILYPICIYESKVVLLFNTYLKSFRAENIIFKVNIIMIALSAVLTYIGVFCFKNINFMVCSILLLFVTKSILLETVLTRLLGLELPLILFQEVCLTLIFLIGNSFIESRVVSVLIYSMSYIVYLCVNRNNFNSLFKKYRGNSIC